MTSGRTKRQRIDDHVDVTRLGFTRPPASRWATFLSLRTVFIVLMVLAGLLGVVSGLRKPVEGPIRMSYDVKLFLNDQLPGKAEEFSDVQVLVEGSFVRIIETDGSSSYYPEYRVNKIETKTHQRERKP